MRNRQHYIQLILQMHTLHYAIIKFRFENPQLNK